MGILTGGHTSQRAVILRLFFGKDKLGSAFAFIELFMGPVVILGPFLTGFLLDKTKSFVAPYIFICICNCFSSILFLISFLFYRQRYPNKCIDRKISIPKITT